MVPADISSAVGVDKAQVSRSVKRLLELRLVERDQIRAPLHLTRDGERLGRRLNRMAELRNRELTIDISDDELSDFYDTIEIQEGRCDALEGKTYYAFENSSGIIANATLKAQEMRALLAVSAGKPVACANIPRLVFDNGQMVDMSLLRSFGISIRDEEGRELPIDTPGELCVRGPQVMKGYWNRPDETARVMTPDGYLRTGDVAAIDAKGFVRIVDRKKDLILVSGFNVYPNEVEQVVAMHPHVLEAAAVGVPDDASGEAVKLYVVKKDPALTAGALIAHCRESLTAYKVPRLVEFIDELPKSNVGKVLRRELRERR